jgi:hypothetical protein
MTMKAMSFSTLPSTAHSHPSGWFAWHTRCKCPDIAFDVHHIRRRTRTPRVTDTRLRKCILCYLVGTVSMKLRMKQIIQHVMILGVYTDGDYGGQGCDRKSISAATIHLNVFLSTGTAPSIITLPSLRWNPSLLQSHLAFKISSVSMSSCKKLVASQHSLCPCSWTIKPLLRKLRLKPCRNAQNTST